MRNWGVCAVLESCPLMQLSLFQELKPRTNRARAHGSPPPMLPPRRKANAHAPLSRRPTPVALAMPSVAACAASARPGAPARGRAARRLLSARASRSAVALSAHGTALAVPRAALTQRQCHCTIIG